MTKKNRIVAIAFGVIVLAIILVYSYSPWVYCVSERQHFGYLQSFPMADGLAVNVWVSPSIQERFNSRLYEHVRAGTPYMLTIQALDEEKNYKILKIQEIVETYIDGSTVTNKFRGKSMRLPFETRNREIGFVCKTTDGIPHKHTNVIIRIIGSLSTIDGQTKELDHSLSFTPHNETKKEIIRWRDRIIY